jgi:hypothetical protein
VARIALEDGAEIGRPGLWRADVESGSPLNLSASGLRDAFPEAMAFALVEYSGMVKAPVADALQRFADHVAKLTPDAGLTAPPAPATAAPAVASAPAATRD